MGSHRVGGRNALKGNAESATNQRCKRMSPGFGDGAGEGVGGVGCGLVSGCGAAGLAGFGACCAIGAGVGALGAGAAAVAGAAAGVSTSVARTRTLSSEGPWRSEEHTSELQSRRDLVCRLLLEK